MPAATVYCTFLSATATPTQDNSAANCKRMLSRLRGGRRLPCGVRLQCIDRRLLATVADPKWIETTFAPRLFEKLHLSSFSKEELSGAFDALDANKNGFLDREEVQSLLESFHTQKPGAAAISPEHTDQLMTYFAGGDSDGLISKKDFEERITHMAKETHPQPTLPFQPTAALLTVCSYGRCSTLGSIP